MDKRSIEYLENYINLTEEIQKKIMNHAKRYGIKAQICAWYKNWVELENLCFYQIHWVLYDLLYREDIY